MQRCPQAGPADPALTLSGDTCLWLCVRQFVSACAAARLSACTTAADQPDKNTIEGYYLRRT